MISGSGKLEVVISEDSPIANYHEKLTGCSYFWLQYDQINEYKYWRNYRDFGIWFANNHWRIGDLEDKGTEACFIKAPGSSDQLPTDLEGQWMYKNQYTQEWIKAGNDIFVQFRNELRFDKNGSK